MRIIHDIEGRATVSGGFRPYTIARGEDKLSGLRVELLILAEENGIYPSEEIHIEGDGAYILDVLKEAVSIIEEAAKMMVEKGDIVEDFYFLQGR